MSGAFNTIIHAPLRLQICAFLAPAEEVEFQALRDALEISDSVLSKHLKQLEEAGYVSQSKRKLGTRQRTWLALTDPGRDAFRDHMEALEALVAVSKIPPQA